MPGPSRAPIVSRVAVEINPQTVSAESAARMAEFGGLPVVRENWLSAVSALGLY